MEACEGIGEGAGWGVIRPDALWKLHWGVGRIASGQTEPIWRYHEVAIVPHGREQACFLVNGAPLEKLRERSCAGALV